MIKTKILLDVESISMTQSFWMSGFLIFSAPGEYFKVFILSGSGILHDWLASRNSSGLLLISIAGINAIYRQLALTLWWCINLNQSTFKGIKTKFKNICQKMTFSSSLPFRNSILLKHFIHFYLFLIVGISAHFSSSWLKLISSQK